jgi:hypothetical protein
MQRFERGEFRFVKASEGVPLDPEAFWVLPFLLDSLQKLCIPTNLLMAGLAER